MQKTHKISINENMANSKIIEHSFEELSQCFRVLLEAHLNANPGGLIFVDRAEAVGNIEAGLTGLLNSFHSLYDAIGKQLEKSPIDWYKSAQLAIILAIRNARHHNAANRIRTLYTYHTQEAKSIQHMEEYILVDFPCSDEGADTFELYVSWLDLKNLLSLSEKETRIKEDTKKIIKEYINTAQFIGYANNYKLDESKVFFNIIPLFVNAAATIVPLIKNYCGSKSVEAKLFASLFSTVTQANTKDHEVNCGPFVLP
jgi:hypothetical protein